MDIALVHSHFDQAHLDTVIAEMQTLGAPTIKAVWMECYGHFAALEGCHRIRAAAHLGLTPIIDEVDYSDDLVDGAEDGLTVSAICDDSHKSEIFNF